eukprot:GDKJ01003306.1.p1 GENE.GDKJ01003306.1~~GDKJ01003306.1.p1  ORF type:complete len:134 (-),score=10.84 GDKJ01003306.1:319-675(-)
MNIFMAVEENGQMSGRPNGSGSYKPRFFPEAQFRVLYAPDVIPYETNDDTVGKFILQNVKYGSYLITNAVQGVTDGDKVIATTDSSFSEKFFWEFTPWEWNKVSKAVELPTVSPHPDY